VLGGARSGKSRIAETIARERAGPGGALVYVATAEALDDEMRARIAAHRDARGAGWRTIDAPLAVAAAIAAEARPGAAVLVDCLTLWLSNLMHRGRDIEAETRDLVTALAAARGPVVLVASPRQRPGAGLPRPCRQNEPGGRGGCRARGAGRGRPVPDAQGHVRRNRPAQRLNRSR
jgi:hypothetical protein